MSGVTYIQTSEPARKSTYSKGDLSTVESNLSAGSSAWRSLNAKKQRARNHLVCSANLTSDTGDSSSRLVNYLRRYWSQAIDESAELHHCCSNGRLCILHVSVSVSVSLFLSLYPVQSSEYFPSFILDFRSRSGSQNLMRAFTRDYFPQGAAFPSKRITRSGY